MFFLGSKINSEQLEVPKEFTVKCSCLREVIDHVSNAFNGNKVPRNGTPRWELVRANFLAAREVVVEINNTTDDQKDVLELLTLFENKPHQLLLMGDVKQPKSGQPVGYEALSVDDVKKRYLAQKIPIGVVGCGVVGKALFTTLGNNSQKVCGYDKYIKEFDDFKPLLNCSVLFLCLPTLYSDKLGQYDKSAIHQVCNKLVEHGYTQEVVIKSTVEPGTTQNLQNKYPTMRFIHNPEFLTARRALEDSQNQSHVVIGYTEQFSDPSNTERLWRQVFKSSIISVTDSNTSECLKLACNCFYSVKVQFFNELAMFCRQKNVVYSQLRRLLLLNKFTSPMHTHVPGPDGKLTFGGMCFPKDTRALLAAMKEANTCFDVLQSTVEEQKSMRPNASHDQNESINLNTVVVRVRGSTTAPDAQKLISQLGQKGATVVTSGVCDVDVDFRKHCPSFREFEKVFCAYRIVPDNVGVLFQKQDEGHQPIAENGNMYSRVQKPNPEYTQILFPERVHPVEIYWNLEIE
jgi:UDPglucose 6-dehydrogenase